MNSGEAAALRDELKALYDDRSKHAIYQSLPAFVASALDYQFPIQDEWRGDTVRWQYLGPRLDRPDLVRWCDFGANTGFFSLTAAHEAPSRQIVAIEANPNHARFIERIRDAFGISNLTVRQQAVGIDELAQLGRHDVLMHLNVLHHAGMDFDRGRVSGAGDFPGYARDYLRRLRSVARILVFHVGSNLWGDKSRPIVPSGDEERKLRLFSGLLVDAGWAIDDISYAARPAQGPIFYDSLPAAVVSDLASGTGTSRSLRDALARYRLDAHVGEFYRRPLFICSSASSSAA
jgi:hypothetical protein